MFFSTRRSTGGAASRPRQWPCCSKAKVSRSCASATPPSEADRLDALPFSTPTYCSNLMRTNVIADYLDKLYTDVNMAYYIDQKHDVDDDSSMDMVYLVVIIALIVYMLFSGPGDRGRQRNDA